MKKCELVSNLSDLNLECAFVWLSIHIILHAYNSDHEYCRTKDIVVVLDRTKQMPPLTLQIDIDVTMAFHLSGVTIVKLIYA